MINDFPVKIDNSMMSSLPLMHFFTLPGCSDISALFTVHLLLQLEELNAPHDLGFRSSHCAAYP